MIEYHYEVEFELHDETKYTDWISRVLKTHQTSPEQLNYVFCSDQYLLNLNQKYLEHDTLTDIITFEYSEGNGLRGDIFVSIERVRENAETYEVQFEEELRRVMIHGVLHLLGFGDKNESEKARMRELENEKLKLFHVEQ